MKSETFPTMADEYTPKYCLQLEAAYGAGMMSEGGPEGIEHMFDQIPLRGKLALDIGSGLGGVVFYLAEKYGMHVTGLEVGKAVFISSVTFLMLKTAGNSGGLPMKVFDSDSRSGLKESFPMIALKQSFKQP